MRVERLAQIAQDHEGWSKRLREADGQIVELDARREQTAAAIAELAAKPAEIEEKRFVLGEEIDKAEANRQEAADRLAIGETRLAEADKALRQAETEMGQARETRVRREGQVEQATKDRESVVERIAERLRCEPDGVMALAEVQSLDELPDLEKAEHKLERLVHERETMGAVNLRAEEEANELEQQITAMTSERDDLVAAIGRLRQGIQSLNREGRERFLVAFEQVSGHFQQLFTKLFGGGKAELRLTESEDPLEAGLEIHASPPGKKLQVMSLLSGGEQALTALSLLFAVFMTNPAPICVLDEVDAPLDDLNVERFCGLVKDIAGRTDTRFLIITHHRVTMARMDRLYGVTMAERGVSQLVSVNLQEADRMVA
jgi:chromosome segregation protein